MVGQQLDPELLNDGRQDQGTLHQGEGVAYTGARTATEREVGELRTDRLPGSIL